MAGPLIFIAFYFLIAVIVFYVRYLIAYIKYRRFYRFHPKHTFKQFENHFWAHDEHMSVLISCFWPIAFIIIGLGKIHNGLCLFIEKIGNKIVDKDND